MVNHPAARLTSGPSAGKRPLAGLYYMNLSTGDALPDLERRLTDALSAALSDAECARLEFAARLAFALEAEERIVPPNQPPAESPPRRSRLPWRRAG
jgi:hypothetical protein